MKKLFVILLITCNLSAWEVTTHRAIDRTALENAQTQNLKNFITDSGLENKDYSNEKLFSFPSSRWECIGACNG